MKNTYSVIILTLFSLLLTSCYSTMTTFDGDVIKELTKGEWNWVGSNDPCNEERQTIEFNKTNTLMTMKWKDKNGVFSDVIYEYNIHEISNSYLKVKMIGEKRKSKEDNLITWDLVIKSPKLYCWHRSDWPKLYCTQDMLLCQAYKYSVII